MKRFITSIIAFLFLVSLCTIAPQKVIADMPDTQRSSGKAGQKDSRTDGEAQAYELFEKILILSDKSDKKDVFEEIEKLYLEIIQKYPDTALAQECYWRLIIHYVNNSTPPMFEKAENMYAEFLRNYPESVIRNLIIDTLSKGYYKSGAWEKIITLNLPAVQAFYETKKSSNPSPLFMYAEAHFNLGNLQEAEKVYRSLIEAFPKSRQASSSRKRLDEMQKKNTGN
jgi:tetratricopeptide (TPR) repeat protein